MVFHQNSSGIMVYLLIIFDLPIILVAGQHESNSKSENFLHKKDLVGLLNCAKDFVIEIRKRNI